MNFIKRSTPWMGLALGASLCSSAMAATPLPDDDWLRVEGNQIVTAEGEPVWLTGANWFGFNTSERILHGLWSVNLEDTLANIAGRGINILRVPISTELLYEWQQGYESPATVNESVNPGLAGATSLDVFDAMIAGSKAVGLKILLDVHSAEADNSGHVAPMWYKGDITPEIFFSTWEWVVERYKNDDTIIAVDLENEPHGLPWSGSDFAKWDDSQDVNNWKYACEKASNLILDINPKMLIMCEGIEVYPKDGVTWTSMDEDDYHGNWWGGNLRGVRDLPVDLGERQGQFMYSPHDYGPLVFDQPWFYEGFNKDTLYEDVWKDNWMFIHEENISPLLIGEWGGFMDGAGNEKWIRAIGELIQEHRLHHTFWCFNPNSGDTGGLVGYDWTTWDEEKYAVLEPTLWKNEQGKFIGLDRVVPLGSAATGVSLGDYLASTVSAVTIQTPASGSYALTGSELSVAYQASKVAAVDVYLNNQLVQGAVSASPVAVTLPASEGEVSIRLVGLDETGQALGASDSIVVNVVDELPLQPQISLVNPSANATLESGGSVLVEVALNDAAGFMLDFAGEQIQVEGSQYLLDLLVPAGDYLLTVTALDSDGASLEVSDSLSLTLREPASAFLSCEVGNLDSWDGGFVINAITVTNTGAQTISDWKVLLEFPVPVTFSQGWSAQYETLSDTEISASGVEYNRQLAPGQSVSFGLQGTHSGGFAAPACVAY